MLREVMYFAQNHMASKWQSQHSSPGSPASSTWPFSIAGSFPGAGVCRLGSSPGPATKSQCDLEGVSETWIKNYRITGDSDGKESACNKRDLGSIPGSRRSPGEGNGYPLHYSCLENPMDRGAWRATVHGFAESDMTEQLTLSHFTFIGPSGLSWWLSGKESTCQCRKCGFNPWVGKIPVEKEMAAHCSILAWRISWTEEPGRLQSRGLQRIGYDWVT